MAMGMNKADKNREGFKMARNNPGKVVRPGQGRGFMSTLKQMPFKLRDAAKRRMDSMSPEQRDQAIKEYKRSRDMNKSLVSILGSRLEKGMGDSKKVIQMPPMEIKAKAPKKKPKENVIEFSEEEGMTVTAKPPKMPKKAQKMMDMASPKKPPMSKSLDPALAARMNTQPISRLGRGVNASTDNAARQQLAKSFNESQHMQVEDVGPRRINGLRPLGKK